MLFCTSMCIGDWNNAKIHCNNFSCITWVHLDPPGPPDVQTDGHQKTAPAFNEYFSTVWNLNIPGSCRWEKVNKNAFALLPLCCIVFGIT